MSRQPQDVIAYRAVGVPANRIFIINRHGEISSANAGYQKSYVDTHSCASIQSLYEHGWLVGGRYPALNEMVDEVFPAKDASGTADAEFNCT